MADETKRSLTPDLLYRRCDVTRFSFKSTAELKDLSEFADILEQALADDLVQRTASVKFSAKLRASFFRPKRSVRFLPMAARFCSVVRREISLTFTS